ncbi:unnamed protein product [Fusarium graminearum]|uniref:BTB domain-containing protein n=1 Tax=Gibberella zeae TaxID=5518 RepID=A0A9N8NG18_GIBZA|nr:unnamed protein product [Fusarium graminearum]CAG2014923.1 unnamed protein product [Fusarium graminearum]
MPGEATCPPQEDGIHGTATEKDNTAELSPYASRICAVHCQSHEVFYVSSALLRQSPVLASHYNRSLCSSLSIPELRLNDVTFSTGHVIIHFLITGTYQCLKPYQDSDAERNVFEFTTALDVYVAAHSYDLPGLRKLARQEIVKLGNRLDLPTFVDAVDNAKLAFDNFPAIGVYAEWRFVSLADPAEHLAFKKMLNCIGAPKTLSMTLLRAILLLKASETPYKSESSEEGISKVPLRYIGSNSSESQLTNGLLDV